ncbi:hypothetical protein JXA12_03245 [Candidatus Woesearchaeota archaeon]|nr:hypothetical protein [Candidatus Woesearchaeota archaeon]
MDSAIITIPLFMALIIGFATQLEDIANDTSDKALAFADDMNNAMECATKGIPISQCSPDLMGYDFTPERESFNEALNDMQEALKNTTIMDEDDNTQATVI